jgi:hypothetical protein
MKKALKGIVQGVKISRSAINQVLKRHRLNGYTRNYKHWKFFRAKGPKQSYGSWILKGSLGLKERGIG